MEEEYLPPSRVGEKLNYDHYIKYTVYPNGEKREYETSKTRKEIAVEVKNWRKETNTF